MTSWTTPMIASGAVGVISVVANLIPSECKEMTSHLLKGNYLEGKRLFDRLYPLAKALMLEVNPQGVKYGVSALGKCAPTLRLPLIEPTQQTKEEIDLQLLRSRR